MHGVYSWVLPAHTRGGLGSKRPNSPTCQTNSSLWTAGAQTCPATKKDLSSLKRGGWGHLPEFILKVQGSPALHGILILIHLLCPLPISNWQLAFVGAAGWDDRGVRTAGCPPGGKEPVFRKGSLFSGPE